MNKKRIILIVIIIVLAIAGWQLWKKYSSKVKNKPAGTNDGENNPYDLPDTSENAELAELTTNAAIALVNKHKNECHLDSDSGDAAEYKYQLVVEPAGEESTRYAISKRTFDALLELGLFASYS